MSHPGGGATFLVTRYRHDPRWRAELRYCADHGIPHSQFLQWDADDREKALLVWQEEQQHCGRCGTYQWQWEEPDPTDDNPHRMRRIDPGIEADLHTCWGCAEFDAVLHEVGQTPGDHHGQRVRWYPVDVSKE